MNGDNRDLSSKTSSDTEGHKQKHRVGSDLTLSEVLAIEAT